MASNAKAAELEIQNRAAHSGYGTQVQVQVTGPLQSV